MAEQLRRQVAPAVARDQPGPEPVAVEGTAVGAQRHLVLRTTIQEVPDQAFW